MCVYIPGDHRKLASRWLHWLSHWPKTAGRVIPFQRKSNNNSINLWTNIIDQIPRGSHSSHNALPFDTINIFLDVMTIYIWFHHYWCRPTLLRGLHLGAAVGCWPVSVIGRPLESWLNDITTREIRSISVGHRQYAAIIHRPAAAAAETRVIPPSKS